MTETLITLGLLTAWLGYGPVLNWIEDKIGPNAAREDR